MRLDQRKFAELNLSNPSSNELNIFDSMEIKYKTKACFFRQLTKTNCEMTMEEEKLINDKIMMYYKKATAIKLNVDKEENVYLEADNLEENNMIRINSQSRINIQCGINMEEDENEKFEDSVINDLNL